MPSSSSVAAVILAGGHGTRMGGCEKPLLSLQGTPVLSVILRALQCSLPASSIALSTNSPASLYAAWKLPLLRDDTTDTGPLSGLLAGLKWARQSGADTLVTIPGDTPFIPDTLTSDLTPAPAVAISDGRRHHLVASWPESCVENLQNWLSDKENKHKRRVRLFADTLDMKEISFSASPYDPFFNINTPDDYAIACQIMQSIKNDF